MSKYLLLLKINYLKQEKNLENLDFNRIYQQNLLKMMQLSRIKYLLNQGLIQKKYN